MAVVSIEMGQKEFAVVGVTGVFNPNDVVKIEGPAADLRGVINGVKNTKYGKDQTPGVGLMIAINRGDLSPFSNGGLAGYTVKTAGGASGTVREPPLLKYPARLMKATELQKMLTAAESLIAKAARLKSDAYAQKWFGTKAATPLELAKIHRRCADLQSGVAGLATVIFQCANLESLGAISTTDPLRHGPTCRIQLGRGFTYDRYSWGERVCTIVHEMSHWFLDTTDEVLTDGSVAYGAACMRMAESDTDYAKTLNNAENWAYYICQYRSDDEAGDWRNFTSEEILQRGPFVPGGYNVVESLISRYN